MSASSNHTTTTANPTVITGGQDIATQPATYLTGTNVAALTVMGRVTATGKIIPCVQTAVDGSNVPVGISVYAVDASAADVVNDIYVGGAFDPAKLVWDASWTAALQPSAFDASNITLKSPAYNA